MQGQKQQVTEQEHLAEGLHAAAIHLLRKVRSQDSTMAQAPARLSALSVLVFGGPMTVGELALAEQVKPPTMSRIVAGLEHDRLVKRGRDADDSRRVQLLATPKGAKLMQRGRRRRIKYLARQFEILNRQELSVLSESLRIMGRVLRDWK